uniref:Uncharacterized protein n=1 Tax=Oryzias latipes TaxID=8090 RepID=A0A3B3H8Z9_ORYLA
MAAALRDVARDPCLRGHSGVCGAGLEIRTTACSLSGFALAGPPLTLTTPPVFCSWALLIKGLETLANMLFHYCSTTF